MLSRSQALQRAFFWAGWASGLVALAAATWVLLNVGSQRLAVADEVRRRHRVKLAGAEERVSQYFDEIWICLGLFASDPVVASMSEGPTGRLQAIYEANYVRHQLAEIYVIKRDFDGSRKPYLTFEMGDEQHDVDTLHALDREIAEHRAQRLHIRRFAEDRTLDSLLSEPLPLCVGGSGLVCSVPVYAADRFVGIVSAMVPLETVSDVLDRSSDGDVLMLADPHGTVLGSQGCDSGTRSWFQDHFGRESVGGFFERRDNAFRVGGRAAVWTCLNAGGRDPWYLVLLYDEDAHLSLRGLAGALTGWGPAALVLLLGGAMAFLCRLAPALLAARQRAEEQARRSAEHAARTRAIVDTAADGILTFDRSGRIESCNRAAGLMFGIPADEAIGRSIDTLVRVPGEGSADEHAASRLLTTRTGDGASRIGFEGRKREGGVFPLEVSVSEVNGTARRLFTGIFRDVSERHRAERAVRESQQFLQRVVDEIPDSIVVMDRDSHVMLTNRAARQMSSDRGIGIGCLGGERDFGESLDPSLEDSGRCARGAVLASKRAATVTHRCSDADGSEVFVEIHAAPVLDEFGEVAQLIEARRDVTARVRAEKQARRQLAELAHVARLSTMGEFASSLAHELNQPLCVIAGMTQACRRLVYCEPVNAAEVAEALEEVSAQAERAGVLIRRLRNFVRKQGPERAPTDMNDVIRNAVAFTEADLRQSGVTVRLDLAASVPPVSADAIQMQQVILNLIRNAIDAMEGVAAGERELHVRSSLSESGELEVAIRDTGIGFPPEGPDRMYDSFFTTKPSGLGIGLSISRSIVEAHGGRMWATANAGHGVTFRFTISTTEDDVSHGRATNRLRGGR